MNKTQKVLKALQAGEELSAKQIASRFSVAKPHNTIWTLRSSGYSIYLNERTDKSGRTTNKYRLGTPSRAIVAAGYKAKTA